MHGNRGEWRRTIAGSRGGQTPGSRRPSSRTARRRISGFEQLETRLAMAGLVINEFLAANTNGLQDEDGDRSDWIELRNTDAVALNVAGWHLTDDASDLDKWTLPAETIPAGGYLLVFASGKGRATAGQPLHANFSLNEAGESLALVRPDGTTVEDAYAPFPAQVANISYGRGASATISESLVGENAPLKVHVPTAANAMVDSTWFTTSFNDASWTSGTPGVGFDTNNSGANFGPYIESNVGPAMAGLRNTAYIRLPFQTANPDDITSLTLRMRYDDGFFVYLNGTEITSARRNAPGAAAFNSAATNSHADNLAIEYEDIDLTPFRHLLTAGSNVLAVHGLNRNTGSLDFLISPLLVAERPSAAVTGYMAAPTPGAANQQGTLGVVADTSFSVDRGFFTNPFNVQISTPTTGTTIRYTLDGSVPTETTGLVYNPAAPPLISTTTTLRAAAFRTGWTPTNVDTQTYIFLNSV
ncbi:MAG TPA: lamin tail domain-containing protein, partial [Lacipirellulaceae bacterium]|nr:lamin tail domain-containing protein [Lacipirellulaceae bacterium]